MMKTEIIRNEVRLIIDKQIHSELGEINYFDRCKNIMKASDIRKKRNKDIVFNFALFILTIFISVAYLFLVDDS